MLLNLLGAFEAVYNKSKRRFTNMFPYILLAFVGATIPISIAGSAAMQRHPLWKPDQYSAQPRASSALAACSC